MRFLAWLEVRTEQFPGTAFAAFILTATAALGPFVATHFLHLWNRPHYQFFPMMLVALGIVGVTRYRDAPPPSTAKDRIKIHLPLLLLCLAGLVTAFRLNSPWMGTVSTICLLLLFARNVPAMSSVVHPLLILLPLPFSLDQDLIHSLQRVSSTGASGLLDASGILHIMSGNVLEVNGGQFFVEEACSGIGSVFLLLASVAIYASWKQLPFFLYAPLLIAAVGRAVAANMFRIFVVAWSHVHGGPELGNGTPHELLGAATYVMALVMLALSEQLFLFLFDPIVRVRSTEPPKTLVQQFTLVLVSWWNQMTSLDPGVLAQRRNKRGVSGILVSRPLVYASLAIVFFVGGVCNGWQLWHSAHAESTPVPPQIALPAPWLDMNSGLFENGRLACQLESFTDESAAPVDHEKSAGRNIKSWKLSVSGTPVEVTLSGPVEKSRSLKERYGTADWKILEYDTHPLPRLTDRHLAVSELILHHRDGHYLHVFAASFHKSAAMVTIPADGSIDGVNSELSSRMSGREFDPADSMWEVRLLIPMSRPIETSARPFWQRSFEELFTTVIDEWRSSL